MTSFGIKYFRTGRRRSEVFCSHAHLGKCMPTNRSKPGLALCLAAGQKFYPGFSATALRKRLSFLFRYLKIRQRLLAFFREPDHDSLSCELLTRPEIMGFIIWPYAHAGWPVMQRFEALAQHQQALCSDMAALAIPASGSLVVADMSDISPGLRLIIDRASWCLREGSLVFNQFLNDDRLMSLSFSFGWLDGERVAYVGSVHGSNVDSALAKYRAIGKDLQGMRSRDFLVKAFQIFTHHMGVKRLLCVSEEMRHHRHPYFGKMKAESLHLNYDEIWHEHAGVKTSDGFYQLASLPVIRSMADIAAKNRPLYRRRYALMDKLSADIASRFGTSNSATQPELRQP